MFRTNLKRIIKSGFFSFFRNSFVSLSSVLVMIVTLAVNAVAQGLMVVYTGGFSPQDAASEAMRFIASSSERREHLVRAGLENAKRFDWGKNAAQVMQAYAGRLSPTWGDCPGAGMQHLRTPCPTSP